jgi:hypothetical protein
MSDSDIKIVLFKCAEARYTKGHPRKEGLSQICVHEHRFTHPMYCLSAFGGPHNIRYGNQAHWLSELKIATKIAGANRLALLFHLDCAYGKYLMRKSDITYSLEAEADFCRDSALYVTDFVNRYIPDIDSNIYLQKHDDAEEIFIFNGTDFVLFKPVLVPSQS